MISQDLRAWAERISTTAFPTSIIAAEAVELANRAEIEETDEARAKAFAMAQLDRLARETDSLVSENAQLKRDLSDARKQNKSKSKEKRR